jgi:DnaJ-class molecular chaperone
MVTVHVDVPKKLSKREKELLDELRDAETTSPRAELGV